MTEISPQGEYRDEQFSGISLRLADLSECIFESCDFQHADFTGARFAGAAFKQCDLSNCLVSSARFFGASFNGCKMLGIDFQEAKDHINVEYTGNILDFCTFKRLSLKNQLFDRCSFREADFTRCDLRSARFKDCSLDGTIFEDAKLDKCDLRGSQLVAVKWDGLYLPVRLDSAQLIQFAANFGVEVDD